MSVFPYSPFVDVPESNLHLLAGVGASIFGAKMGSLALEGIFSSEQIGQKNNDGFSITKTKTKMRQASNKRQRTLATVATVKRMIGGVLEKKQMCYMANQAFAVSNTNIAHSTNLTAKILQGTTDGTRVGDSVTLNSLHFNMTFLTAQVASYYRYRVIFGWSGEEYNPTNFGTTTGLAGNEIFIGATSGSGNDTATQIINTKAFTPIYDTLVEINSNISAVNDGKSIRGVVSLAGQKFDYQQAGSVQGKKKNLFCIIVPVYGGAVPLDIGYSLLSICIKYQDA